MYLLLKRNFSSIDDPDFEKVQTAMGLPPVYSISHSQVILVKCTHFSPKTLDVHSNVTRLGGTFDMSLLSLAG
jgi:hypothetical protein